MPNRLPLHTLIALLLAACLALPARAEEDRYTQTRHPIVLVHGLFGFAAIGPLSYFGGIAEALRDGGATVYTPSVSAAHLSEVRGEQLLFELRALKAAYGHEKFHLIGHSHGGPTARYVAAVAPELVASVTSVGSPHTGSKTADALKEMSRRSGTPALMANALSNAVAWLSGEPGLPQDALGALQSLDSEGAAVFNRRFPQGQPAAPCGEGAAVVDGVRYYSLGGTRVATNALDPSDAVLAITSRSFGDEPNDGLVGRCASHWGVVLRDDYEWNHLDEVNQSFGLRGPLSPDPRAVYRLHANRLKWAELRGCCGALPIAGPPAAPRSIEQVRTGGSLRGSELDGDWGAWRHGRLRAGAGLFRRFDHLLSALGETDLRELQEWIAREVIRERDAAAAGQVLLEWQSHLARLQGQSPPGQDEAVTPGSSGEPAAPRRRAPVPVPRALLLPEAAGAELQAEQRADLQQQRSQQLGSAAAERLAQEDAARWAWAQRLAQARTALLPLVGEAREVSLARQFSPGSERLRARTLLGFPP
ncbi:alpha/beta fold hydrolase [Sphaerotilaceae bacterium SBD11-9]